MNVLKNIAIAILSFLLFLSLSIFGIAFLLNQTILNPNFITSELDRVDVSQLVEDIVVDQSSQNEEIPENFSSALIDTINKLENPVKEQIGTITYTVVDYLRGHTDNLDIALTLRNTFLNSEFVTSLVNELDISSLASDFINEQIGESIPGELEFLNEHLDEAIADLEPFLKEAIIDAADPILDYVLGESQNIDIVISLEPVTEDLEVILRGILISTLPPEYASLSPNQLDQLFAEYFTDLTEMIPASIEIDETLLGAGEGLTQARQGIIDAIGTVERELEQVRQYIDYFQLGYNILIGVIILLIISIVLLNLNVRGATRKLGTIFLTYGAIEYAGIFVIKYLSRTQLSLVDIPASIQALVPQLISDFLHPLEMLSLGILIGGAALIVVSFVYKRNQSSE
ncbi:MAG: hypothetical protein PHQ86_05260 [Dehalococcoidales bacterium]|nr:hypothetical protein [Dehalococcoidales bacterium]